MSERIVRAGTNFWTRPPTGERVEPSDVEAPVVDGSDQDNGAAVPVSEPEIEAILVEDPGIEDPLDNLSVVPVADLPEVEPESEPEIFGDVAVQSRPDDVRVRVDACRTGTVDQHDDDVTLAVTAVMIAALAWLIFRRSHARRR